MEFSGRLFWLLFEFDAGKRRLGVALGAALGTNSGSYSGMVSI